MFLLHILFLNAKVLHSLNRKFVDTDISITLDFKSSRFDDASFLCFLIRKILNVAILQSLNFFILSPRELIYCIENIIV